MMLLTAMFSSLEGPITLEVQACWAILGSFMLASGLSFLRLVLLHHAFSPRRLMMLVTAMLSSLEGPILLEVLPFWAILGSFILASGLCFLRLVLLRHVPGPQWCMTRLMATFYS